MQNNEKDVKKQAEFSSLFLMEVDYPNL